jgi:hypothetical protein
MPDITVVRDRAARISKDLEKGELDNKMLASVLARLTQTCISFCEDAMELENQVDVLSEAVESKEVKQALAAVEQKGKLHFDWRHLKFRRG